MFHEQQAAATSHGYSMSTKKVSNRKLKRDIKFYEF